MRRPAGVTVAGILLLFFSLFELMLIGLQIVVMLLTHSASTAIVPHGELMLLVVDGFLFALAVLSAWTAIALFRMRTWARYVTILLAALGACFAGLTMMVCLLLRHTALPVPNMPPALEQRIFILLAAFCGIMTLIAVYWIVYFNRATVRAAFARAAALRQGQDAYSSVILSPRHEHARVSFAQIIVWIVGVLLFLGGFSLVFLAWREIPVFMLGWLATGLAAVAVELLWACLLFYAGLGLLLRWRAGWIIAVGLQLYSLLSVFLLLIPGYTPRMIHAMRVISTHYWSLSTTASAFAPETNARFLMASSALGGALALGILIALARCRHRYLQLS